MRMSYFRPTRPDCIFKSFYVDGREMKYDCLIFVDVCSHQNTALEAMSCFYHFCLCDEFPPSAIEEDIQHGDKRKDVDELIRSYEREKGLIVIEMWEFQCWRLYKRSDNVKIYIPENFSIGGSLAAEQLLEKLKNGNMSGYVQYDTEVPEKMTASFASFCPIFNITLVSRNDIGDLLRTYAEKENILSPPRRIMF